jgi:putative transposase
MNEALTRTVCIKLDVTGHELALEETQACFNEAATWIAAVCWQERITNSNTAHHRVYGQTRARFWLGAQLAVCARAKAMEAVKATRAGERNRMARWKATNARRRKVKKKLLPPPDPASCPEFHPRASVRYDARTYRLLPLDKVSLSTLTGRVVCRMLPGKRQHEMLVDPDWHIGGAELVWQDGTYYLHLTQTREAPPLSETSDVLGVDLGICNVATDSTGQQFTGREVRLMRSHAVARRAALQRVGTRSAKRRLQKMRRRERRWMKHVNHRIAKTLVRKAAVSRKALALEDLTGIREGEVTVRRENRYERHSWAFYQLRTFLTYKAAWAGVPVHLVDPAYTSQTCSRCGYGSPANRQSQSSFKCKQCGFCCHADSNAAMNIAQAGRQAAYGSGGTSPATSPRALAGGS